MIVEDEMPQQHSDFFAGREQSFPDPGRPQPRCLSRKQQTSLFFLFRSQLTATLSICARSVMPRTDTGHVATRIGIFRDLYHRLSWAALGDHPQCQARYLHPGTITVPFGFVLKCLILISSEISFAATISVIALECPLWNGANRSGMGLTYVVLLPSGRLYYRTLDHVHVSSAICPRARGAMPGTHTAYGETRMASDDPFVQSMVSSTFYLCADFAMWYWVHSVCDVMPSIHIAAGSGPSQSTPRRQPPVGGSRDRFLKPAAEQSRRSRHRCENYSNWIISSNLAPRAAVVHQREHGELPQVYHGHIPAALRNRMQETASAL